MLGDMMHDALHADVLAAGESEPHHPSLAGLRSGAVTRVEVLLRSLGVATTAEGVETAERSERFRAEGCDEAQGYHLGRPMPVGDIAAMLHAATAHPASVHPAGGKWGRLTRPGRAAAASALA